MIGRGAILGAVTLVSVSAAAQPAPPPCAERIGRLQSTFRTLEIRPRAVAVLPNLPALVPPRGKKGPLLDDTSTVIVEYGLEATYLQGRPLSPATENDIAARIAAINQAIEEHQKTWRMLHPREKPAARTSLSILFDARMPASDALAVTELLGAQHNVALLTLGESVPLPVRTFPAHVTQRMKEVAAIADADERVRQQGITFGKALAGCPGKKRFFEDADGSVESIGNRGKKMHAEIVSALKACSCGAADLEMIEAAFLATADLAPPVHAHAVKGRAHDKLSATVPGTLTVQDLVDRLPAR